MTAKAMHDLSDEYIHWLKSNLIVFEQGSAQVLSTPFLDPFNDGIEISLDVSGGEMVLHDSGHTLQNLMDMGIHIETSERRRAIIQNAIAGCGVRLNRDRLETVVTHANRAQRLHFLTTAILRLNDLWMTASPRTTTDFFEVVKEFFDANDILYTANKSITGRTVEHPIDFIIPLPKGRDRLVKLVPRPSIQAAKLASFTWVDLQEAQPEAERVVFLNDIVGEGDTVTEGGEQRTKAINESVIAILKGYCHKIYSWSEAVNDPRFATSIRST